VEVVSLGRIPTESEGRIVSGGEADGGGMRQSLIKKPPDRVAARRLCEVGKIRVVEVRS